MKVRVISDKFSPFSKGEIIDHRDNDHLRKIIAMGKVELVEEEVEEVVEEIDIMEEAEIEIKEDVVEEKKEEEKPKRGKKRHI